MKKKIVSLALVICALAMLGTSTIAYFTADGTASNVFTTGKIDVAVVETTRVGDDELPYEDILDAEGKLAVMPSTTISKIVKVEGLQNSADAYIRVQVEKEIDLDENFITTDTQKPFTPDLGLIEIDFNETHWTYNETDGYYYYNSVLKAGEKTEALFNSVTFSTDMGNEYQNSTAMIKIIAQAVQVVNNGTTALEAQGWSSYLGEV